MHPVAKIYPWIILAVLFLARMALGYQFQSIASVAPFLVNSLHVNYAEIGSLIGIYMLPGAFVSLPAGLIGRHVGDRSFAVTALALMAAGGVIVALSHGYALALVGRLTSGAGNAMLNMVLTKMVTDWFAERGLALAMGILLASWPFAIGTGLIVHNMIASRWGWPVVMYSTAAFCALAMLLVAVIYHAPGSRRRAKAVRKSEAGSASLALPPLNESLPALVSGSIWGTYNIALLVFFSFAPLLLVEHGALRGEAASWVSTALWIGMVSVPLGGFLVQRIGRGNCRHFHLLLSQRLGLRPPAIGRLATDVMRPAGGDDGAAGRRDHGAAGACAQHQEPFHRPRPVLYHPLFARRRGPGDCRISARCDRRHDGLGHLRCRLLSWDPAAADAVRAPAEAALRLEG